MREREILQLVEPFVARDVARRIGGDSIRCFYMTAKRAGPDMGEDITFLAEMVAQPARLLVPKRAQTVVVPLVAGAGIGLSVTDQNDMRHATSKKLGQKENAPDGRARVSHNP